VSSGCGCSRLQARRAFTIFELLTAIVIVAILGALLLLVFSGLSARAQRAQCTANLHNLYVATEGYIQQNGSWPQILQTDADDADQAYARDWIKALSPFGPTQRTWICPTMQGMMGNPDLSQPENARLDYTAMPFDDKPITPHQWPRQPWFVERGDVHGSGNLVIFTDGSVSDVNTISAGAAH
jgi:type II secretory pathway pseudopilin PulG